MISPGFAWLGAALPLAGFASYARETLRGRARPNRVSWALWAAAPLTAFAAEVTGHVDARAALVTLALGFGPLAVLAASLASPQAHWKLTPADLGCGAASVLALELWAVTRQGSAAIALAIVADGLAAVPTIRKSRVHPESESPQTYLASGAGAVLTLLTVRHWTFTACAFPAYVATVCAVIAALILVPRAAAGRLPAATVLRRGGWAAGTAVSLAAIAVAGLGITGTLTAPLIPPGLAPAAAVAQIGARSAYPTTAARRPGVPHHRRRRYEAASALLPGPGSPPPLTASPSPSRPSPQSRTPGPGPTSPSSTAPYPASPPPDPPPPASPSPSPCRSATPSTTPTTSYGG